MTAAADLKNYMDIHSIPVISVSYNSAELIEDLLSTFRAHYRNPVTIIDGSSEEHWRGIEAVCSKYPDVKFIHFDYNIHHGPGMAWAFQHLELKGPVLVLDSDIQVMKGGFLEDMLSHLTPEMYGVGYVNHVNEGGFDVDYEEGAIRYLHPACMLVNIDVLRQWPMPTRHGAPNTEPMVALHRAGKDNLVKGLDWLRDDFHNKQPLTYLRHDWQGTVKRTGGYHLEAWEARTREASVVRMLTQTLMPQGATRIVEIGANDGALARAIKEASPSTHYTAIEINPDLANQARGACDVVLTHDVDALGDDFFRGFVDTQCWVLDRALERLRSPELLLQRIRKVIGKDGSVVAVVPNMQHWSIQAKLALGDLRYEDGGLLDRSHLRWFTRGTMFELFQKCGFTVAGGMPVIHEKLENPNVLDALRQLASSVGADPQLAVDDAQAVAYVIRAVPK
ncbi:methyltransferase domain-containing protein [Pseudoduganella sp. RAF53_2]|uniref:methyltransferase domain-containing protein n=1 Tax=unclassified Pseudoduganella TaxID=2637179 RepID=UPI003F94C333